MPCARPTLSDPECDSDLPHGTKIASRPLAREMKSWRGLRNDPTSLGGLHTKIALKRGTPEVTTGISITISASENPAAGRAVTSPGCITASGRRFQFSQGRPEIGLTSPVL